MYVLRLTSAVDIIVIGTAFGVMPRATHALAPPSAAIKSHSDYLTFFGPRSVVNPVHCSLSVVAGVHLLQPQASCQGLANPLPNFTSCGTLVSTLLCECAADAVNTVCLNHQMHAPGRSNSIDMPVKNCWNCLRTRSYLLVGKAHVYNVNEAPGSAYLSAYE